MCFLCKLNLIKLKSLRQRAKVDYIIITESFSFYLSTITLKMRRAKENYVCVDIRC